MIGAIKRIVSYRAGTSAILTMMSMAGAARSTRARIALHVFLRLTAMDVCCGPPSLA
jgi:hypothetical protein